MRPPEFTGGNTHLSEQPNDHALHASMRPPEFTGGNILVDIRAALGVDASMRPPEFTGGNVPEGTHLLTVAKGVTLQ